MINLNKENDADVSFAILKSDLNIIQAILDDILAQRKKISASNSNPSDTSDNTHIAECQHKISLLRQKLDDPRFYLGIVGEFSSGKSTFINAFLEDDTLKCDPIKGTTCANTIIEYAEKPNVIVKYADDVNKDSKKTFFGNVLSKIQTLVKSDPDSQEVNSIKGFFTSCIGRVKTLGNKLGENKENSNFSSIEEMQKYLQEVTANEERAKNLREVYWQTPNPILNNGLVLIDTPGISNTDRHTMAATKAAKEQSDSLIVLSDMNKPLSNELLTFVQTVTDENASGCIFVGTRKDSLPPKELPRQENFFTKKLSDRFKRHFAFGTSVFFVSAYKMVVGIQNTEKTPEDIANIEEFRQFREDVKNMLRLNRAKIQSKKIAFLIAELAEKLSSEAGSLSADFNKQRQEIEKQLIVVDKEHWEILRNNLITKYKDDVHKMQIAEYETIMNAFNKMRNQIFPGIQNAPDADNLKEVLKNSSTYINSAISTLNHDVKNSFNKLPSITDNIQNQFFEKYRNAYAPLKQYLQKSVIDDFVPPSLRRNINKGHLASVTKGISKSMEKEEEDRLGSATGYGIAAGIALNFVFPGLGFILGGILGGGLGGFIGSLFGPSLDKLKNDAIAKLDAEFKTTSQKFANDFIKEHSRIAQEYCKYLNDIICTQISKNEEYIAYINDGIKQKSALIAETEQIFLKHQAELASLEETLK